MKTKSYVLRWIILLVPFLSGCTVVEPWERSMLSAPHMSLEPNGLDATFLEHMNTSREGTFGGYGLNAGGCGCN